MRNTLIFFICLSVIGVKAQDLSYSKPGKQFYPDLPNPVRTDKLEWSKLKDEVNVSFASDNVKYPKEKPPVINTQTTWTVTAWKGEKVHTQLLVWSKKNIGAVQLQVSDLTGASGVRIPSANCKARFIRYTLANDFAEGCSQGPASKYDSFLVSDPIDIIKEMPVAANTVQPVWLSVEVPRDIPAGKYSGTVTVNAGKAFRLQVSLTVIDKTLPPPSEWKYDFDMWQYPAPIARIHNVPLWSDEHFKLMREYFTYLASAGQKVITANIIEQPWGLDHVHFDDPTLIKWTKKRDGSWVYDFTMFDKYVSFVMSCGITQRINCYTMITWDLGFIYFDEASGKNKTDTLKPGSPQYDAFWEPMLRQFTQFLKTKGWFSKTAIAMDERPVESMQAVIALLKKIDPQWKIALAGDTYHPEIADDIYDYCLASYLDFDEATLKRRKSQGKPTTYYTACVEKYPNGYTVSPPAENAWLAWHAAAKGLTGYLFWAYNTWVPNPLQDTRWRRYPAGELFEFYPGPRTSMRFEKLIEGIQDFEKIRILREGFTRQGNTEGTRRLDAIIAEFQIEKLKTIPAADMLEKGKRELLALAMNDDTQAIQAAIDKAYNNKGGVVEIPAGVYKIGTLILKDNVELHLQHGAVLMGSPDYKDYLPVKQQLDSRTKDLYAKYFMIFAEGANNIAITGSGTIHGNGLEYFQEERPQNLRPNMIRLVNCTNVTVRDVHLLEAANWTFHLLGCTDVNIDGIVIENRGEGNRDGLDIDACKRVTVANSRFSTTDDAIVMKATNDTLCQDITITNCVFREIGGSALKTGTESNGGFKNITVSNCVIKDINVHAGIELMTVDGGMMQNILFENIVMDNVATPFFIRLGARARPYKPGQYVNRINEVKDIQLNNISAINVKLPSSIIGLHSKKIGNVSVSNYTVRYSATQEAVPFNKVPFLEFDYPAAVMFSKLPAYGLYCRSVDGLHLQNVNIYSSGTEQRPAITLDRTDHVSIFGTKASVKNTQSPMMHLRHVNDITVANSGSFDASDVFIETEENSVRQLRLVSNAVHAAQAEQKNVPLLTDAAVFDDFETAAKYNVTKDDLPVTMKTPADGSLQLCLLALNNSATPAKLTVRYDGMSQEFLVDWKEWGWAPITLLKQYKKGTEIKFDISSGTGISISKAYLRPQDIGFTD